MMGLMFDPLTGYQGKDPRTPVDERGKRIEQFTVRDVATPKPQPIPVVPQPAPTPTEEPDVTALIESLPSFKAWKQGDAKPEPTPDYADDPEATKLIEGLPSFQKWKAESTAHIILPETEEPAFQQWYKQWADKAGIDPNPDNPLHKYDYRAAFKAGVTPEINPDDGLYHWPSQFKDDDHPNRFVNGMDTKTGMPVKPPTPAEQRPISPFEGRAGQARLSLMEPILKARQRLSELQPGTPEYKHWQANLADERQYLQTVLARDGLDLSDIESALPPTEKEVKGELSLVTIQDRKAEAQKQLKSVKDPKRKAFLEDAIVRADEASQGIMDIMDKEASLPGQLLKRTAGAAKGGLSGLTFGLSDVVPISEGQSLQDMADESGYGGTLAEGVGSLMGGFYSGAKLFGGFQQMLNVKTLPMWEKVLITRLGSGAATSGGQNLTQYAAGKKDLPDAIRDTGIGMGAWVIGMVPQYAAKSGTSLQKLANASGQVMTDFMYDLGTDAAFTENMKDRSFRDWFVQSELPRLANSVVTGAMTLKDVNLPAERAQIIKELNGMWKSDHAAFTQSGQPAPVATPEAGPEFRDIWQKTLEDRARAEAEAVPERRIGTLPKPQDLNEALRQTPEDRVAAAEAKVEELQKQQDAGKTVPLNDALAAGAERAEAIANLPPNRMKAQIAELKEKQTRGELTPDEQKQLAGLETAQKPPVEPVKIPIPAEGVSESPTEPIAARIPVSEAPKPSKTPSAQAPEKGITPAVKAPVVEATPSTKPAEVAPTAEMTGATPSEPRTFTTQRKAMTKETPLIDRIVAAGGIRRPTDANRNSPEYGPLIESPLTGKAAKVWGGKMADTADKVAQDQGFDSVEAMWDAIRQDAKAKTNRDINAEADARAEYQAKTALAAEATKRGVTPEKVLKQDDAFQKVNIPKKGDEVPARFIDVGEEVTIAGEKFKVTKVDPETGEVELTDGKKYGIQKVDANEMLYVEKIDKAAGEDVLSAQEKEKGYEQRSQQQEGDTRILGEWNALPSRDRRAREFESARQRSDKEHGPKAWSDIQLAEDDAGTDTGKQLIVRAGRDGNNLVLIKSGHLRTGATNKDTGTIFVNASRPEALTIYEHESFHLKLSRGDPKAKALLDVIDTQSDAFKAYKKAHEDAGVALANDSAYVEELAADLYANRTRNAGVNTIDTVKSSRLADVKVSTGPSGQAEMTMKDEGFRLVGEKGIDQEAVVKAKAAKEEAAKEQEARQGKLEVAPKSLAESLNAGEPVKPPKGATFVEVTDAKKRTSVVNVKDLDTLKDAGITKARWVVKGVKGVKEVAKGLDKAKQVPDNARQEGDQYDLRKIGVFREASTSKLVVPLPRWKNLYDTLAVRWKRQIDSIVNRGPRRGAKESAGIEEAPDFAKSDAYRIAHHVIEANGFDSIPIRGRKSFFDPNPHGKPRIFIEEHAPSDVEYLTLHEITHGLQDKGDVRALELRKLISKKSEAFEDMRRELEADGTPTELIDEMAADEFVAGYVGGSTLPIEQMFSDPVRAIALRDEIRSDVLQKATTKPLAHKPAAPRPLTRKALDLAKSLEESAKADEAKARGRVSQGVDPTILLSLAKRAAAKILRGVARTPKDDDAIVAEYGEEYRPHLDAIHEQAEAIIEDATSHQVAAIAKTPMVEQLKATGAEVPASDYDPTTFAKRNAEVDARIAQEPDYIKKTVDAYADNPNLKSGDVETTAVLRAATDVGNRINEANKRGASAEELEPLLREQTRIAKAARHVGAQAGSALQSMQQVMNEDFTFGGLLRQYESASGSDAPPPKNVVDDAKRISKEYADAKAAEALARKDEEIARLNKAIDDIKKTAEKARPVREKVAKAAKGFDEWHSRQVAEARKRLGLTTTLGVDPTRILDLAIVGSDYIKKGAKAFGEWSKPMIKDFGDSIKEHLPQIWAKANDFLTRAPKMYDAAIEHQKAAGKLKKLTTVPEETVPEGGGWSLRQKKIGSAIRQLTRAVWEENDGKMSRDELVAEVERIANDELGMKLTRTEVVDGITGYGDFSMPNPEELARGLRETKRQLLKLRQIQDAEAGLRQKMTGKQRDPQSPEMRRLEKIRRETMRKMGIQTETPEQGLKSALDAVRTRLENEIYDLDEAIKTKTPLPEQKAKLEYPPDLKEMQARRDELKAQYDAIFKKELTDDERLDIAIRQAEKQAEAWDLRVANAARGVERVKPMAKPLPESARLAELKQRKQDAKDFVENLRKIKAAKTPEELDALALAREEKRLTKRADELQRRITEKDFSVRPRKEHPISAKTVAAQRRIEALQGEWNEVQLREEYRKLDLVNKALYVADALPVVANITSTSIDVSGVGKQGALAVAAMPIKAIKATKHMLAAFASETASRNQMERIKARPNAKYYDLRDINKPQAKTWPALVLERWVGKLPLMRASQRAFATIINTLHADVVDYLLASRADIGGKITPEAGEMAKEVANMWTGKGEAGRADFVLRGATRVFWSPSLQLSRLQVLALAPFYKRAKSGTIALDAPHRKAVAKLYARTLAGYATLFGAAIAAGAQIETDSDSSDYGKLRFGGKVYDVLGGMAQWVVFNSRLITGQTVRGSGEIVPLREDETHKPPYGGGMERTITQMARSKLNPLLSFGWNVATGRDFRGERITRLQALAQAIAPLSLNQLSQSLQDEGLTESSAWDMMSFLGVNVTKYSREPPMKINKWVSEYVKAHGHPPSSDEIQGQMDRIVSYTPEERAGYQQEQADRKLKKMEQAARRKMEHF